LDVQAQFHHVTPSNPMALRVRALPEVLPMGRPEPIDMATWARAEHFEHYRTRVPCSYAITVEIDVTELTALRRSGRKTYAALVWAPATVVNRHDEFRLTLGRHGSPPSAGTSSGVGARFSRWPFRSTTRLRTGSTPPDSSTTSGS
jgi:hypothetical protein